MDSKKKDDTGTFTIDNENTQVGDMPSVTRLLNRKSLKEVVKKSPPPSPASSPKSHAELSPPPSIELAPSNPTSPDLSGIEKTPDSGHEISISPTTTEGGGLQIETRLDSTSQSSTSTSSTISSPPRIQAARRPPKSVQNLVIWERSQLASGADPLGKGITAVLEKGATHVLFLAIVPPPTGSPVPHFNSSAAVNPQSKLGIWTGLKWDPTVVPEMWNAFVKAGLVELSPPGANTVQTSNRNVVRSALGILQSEWLLLVRAGPSNACRGVIAFVSLKSLVTELASALPLLSAPAPVSKKVA